MPTGIPIIVSVTNLDESFYGPDPFPRSDEERLGPQRDGESIKQGLFDFQQPPVPGMRPAIWLTSDGTAGASATRNALIGHIQDAAQTLTGQGDTLFVYYSGHGALLPSGTVGNEDRTVLCLTDGFLFDVELVALWNTFPASARIFFIADCCHAADAAAGSIVQQIVRAARRLIGRDPRGSVRSLDDNRAIHAASNSQVAGWLTTAMSNGGGTSPPCAVLNFAACAADEVINTPMGQSDFAAKLVEKFMTAGPYAGYADFAEAVIRELESSTLSPSLDSAGRTDAAFAVSIPPFTL